MTIQVILEIPDECITNLMVTAIESGDPVTTAARGGWCRGIHYSPPIHKLPMPDDWYAKNETWAGQFHLNIVEVDDETTGHETRHNVDRARVSQGLSIMATKYPRLFQQILADNIDAPCADIFLQCVLFGEEKYA